MWKLALFLIAVLATTGAAAQSPAVGPQEPAPGLANCNPSQSNRPCKSEFGLFIVTNMIRNTTQKVLDGANAEIQKRGHSSRVSIDSLRSFAPRRQQTQHLNQPNEWFIRVPYMLTVKVTIPVTSDRRITIPLDIDFRCNNWQTGDGRIVLRSTTGPASFEGGNILESVFNVGNFIDAQVRNNFVQPPPVTQQIPNATCSTIGGSNLGTADTGDDIVLWTVPRTMKVPLGEVAAISSVEVTFNRLKRLRARGSGGGILYQDAENILLNVSANTSRQQKSLTMRENDDVALNLPAIRMSPASFDQLVIIGNVEQPPNNPKDSASVTATKAQGFRAGTHVLNIPKWYSRPPGQGSTKPTFVSVPAYALTYTVRYSAGNVLTQGGGAGAAGGAGAVGTAGTAGAGSGTATKKPTVFQRAPGAILQRQ